MAMDEARVVEELNELVKQLGTSADTIYKRIAMLD